MSNLPLVAAASGAMLVNQPTAERIDAGAFDEGDPFDEIGDEPEQR